MNQDNSPNAKQNGKAKKQNLNSVTNKQLFKKPKKEIAITTEFDSTIKNRTSSQFTRPSIKTPVKPAQPQYMLSRQPHQPQESKVKSPQIDQPSTQIITVQQNTGLRIKTQQCYEKPKESPRNILKRQNAQQQLIQPHVTRKVHIDPSKVPQSNKLSPQGKSFSPLLQLGLKSSTPRVKSPIKQIDAVDASYKAILSLVRPIFKDAKYYQTSAIHFLREQFLPKSSAFRMQFKLEFSEEQENFKNLFCDHFNLTFNSLQHCKNLKRLGKPNPLLLNPAKEPKYWKGQQVRTIIFDLDETLIHCNDHNDNATDHETVIHMPNEGPSDIRFNVRPFCQQMLKVLSQHFELILFTASYREYADKILEVLDPDKSYFAYRFYRDSCQEMEDGLLIKDLSVIEGRQLENIVIVDNSAYCYYFQLDHGIPIIPFYENKRDKELIFLTDYLLKVEKQPQWIYQHKQQFKNYFYLQCTTIEECIKRVIQTQNY